MAKDTPQRATQNLRYDEKEQDQWKKKKKGKGGKRKLSKFTPELKKNIQE